MIPFHKLLISTAIVFSAGMAAWSFWRFAQVGGAGWLALGLAFVVVTLALAYYLRNLKRFLGR